MVEVYLLALKKNNTTDRNIPNMEIKRSIYIDFLTVYYRRQKMNNQVIKPFPINANIQI